MQLYFVSTQLRKLCSSEKELVRRFGDRRGRVIARRLTELVALPALSLAYEVPHLRLHQLKAERDGQYAITVVDPYRLIVRPAENPVPRRDDGGIDPERVESLVVVEIVDYH